MPLARTVVDAKGRTLATAGNPVSVALSARMAEFGIDSVYVEDPRFEGIDLEDEVPQALIAEVNAMFAALAEEFAAGRPPAPDPAQAARIAEDLIEWTDTGHPLTLLRPRDESRYLPVQAINGARLALAAAAYVDEGLRVRDLALAGLLRDLGMLAVPLAVRSRPGPLMAEETAEVQAHVARSLAALEHPYWNPFVKVAISRHHERLDGSGYPEGLSGDAVHALGALLGTVDCYCALVAPRPYRPALRPEEALEMLLGLADWQLSTPAVRAVAQCVGLYPRGTVVRLSTGEDAVVTHPGRGTFERPQVRRLADARPVDLRRPENLHIQIAEVVED